MYETDQPKLISCLNCGNSFEGIICNQCGQKPKDPSLTTKGLVLEWWESRMTDYRQFLHTTRDLLLRPGSVFHDYLAGRRKRYYNATNYFLLVASLATFVTLQFRSFDAKASIEKWTELYAQMGIPSGDNEFGMLIMDWLMTHYNIAMLLTLPFLAWSSYLLFRKRKLNFGEHMLLHFFAYSVINLLLLPTYPFVNPANPDSSAFLITSTPTVLYYCWVFKDTFELSWGKAVLTGLLFYALYFILFLLTIVLLTIVAIILTLLVILGIKMLT
jgi:hypothetical protein